MTDKFGKVYIFTRTVCSTGIYKPGYIDELCRVYGDGSETMLAPSLPSWCSQFDDDQDGLYIYYHLPRDGVIPVK